MGVTSTYGQFEGFPIVRNDLHPSCPEDCAIGLSSRLDEHCQRGGHLRCIPEAYSYPVGNAAELALLVHRSCGFQREGLRALIEFPLVGFRETERWAAGPRWIPGRRTRT
jgi:hypothetical protein